MTLEKNPVTRTNLLTRKEHNKLKTHAINADTTLNKLVAYLLKEFLNRQAGLRRR